MCVCVCVCVCDSLSLSLSQSALSLCQSLSLAKVRFAGPLLCVSVKARVGLVVKLSLMHRVGAQ